ncbi:MAG: hypothetical protein ABSF46_26500 [Terriglobia bacterium]|jgi:hypothetical protein
MKTKGRSEVSTTPNPSLPKEGNSSDEEGSGVVGRLAQTLALKRLQSGEVGFDQIELDRQAWPFGTSQISNIGGCVGLVWLTAESRILREQSENVYENKGSQCLGQGQPHLPPSGTSTELDPPSPQAVGIVDFHPPASILALQLLNLNASLNLHY